jgi:hypothetical protein
LIDPVNSERLAQGTSAMTERRAQASASEALPLCLERLLYLLDTDDVSSPHRAEIARFPQAVLDAAPMCGELARARQLIGRAIYRGRIEIGCEHAPLTAADEIDDDLIALDSAHLAAAEASMVNRLTAH